MLLASMIMVKQAERAFDNEGGEHRDPVLLEEREKRRTNGKGFEEKQSLQEKTRGNAAEGGDTDKQGRNKR